jgi:biopolymer transport protein ExbB/TolQ
MRVTGLGLLAFFVASLPFLLGASPAAVVVELLSAPSAMETSLGVGFQRAQGEAKAGTDGGMSFSLIDSWNCPSPSATLVNLVLFLMCLASLSVGVERLRFFRSIRAAESIRAVGADADAEGLGRNARRRAMERVSRAVEHELGRGLRNLLALGLLAPLVGILGALIGLWNALRGISLTGSSGIGAVSAGLTEALFPFLYALLVGIPSFWAYAYFRARIDRMVLQMGDTVRELDF